MFMYTLGFVNKAPEETEEEDDKSSVSISTLLGSFKNLIRSTSVDKMEADYYAAVGTRPQSSSRGDVSSLNSSHFEKEENKDIERGIELERRQSKHLSSQDDRDSLDPYSQNDASSLSMAEEKGEQQEEKKSKKKKKVKKLKKKKKKEASEDADFAI